MTIPDLIERLEKALGPDRELDFDIAYAIDWQIHSHCGWREYADKYPKLARRDNYPHYTKSIDAALTMMPEGFGWSVDHEPSVLGRLPLVARALGMHASFAICMSGAPSHRTSPPKGRHNVPAIALCIAILRAIEATARSEGKHGPQR